MSAEEAKRRTEKWICAELEHALPLRKAYPAKGDDEPEAPFFFVKVVDMRDMTPTGALRPVFQFVVRIARVCHIGEENASDHSTEVGAMRGVLATLVGVQGTYAPEQLLIHGFDFQPPQDGPSDEEIRDAEGQGFADAITCVCGASLLD